MKKLVIRTDALTEAQMESFKTISPELDCVFIDSYSGDALPKDADAVIGNFPAEALAECKRLEWLQLLSSGADAYAKSALPEDLVITTATGAYGAGIAEYMVAMLINMMKKVPAYLDNQRRGVWKSEGLVTSPAGKRVLIVGTGNLGREFAKRIKPFGAVVVGLRRRSGAVPENFDEMHLLSELSEELERADVVALCLPGTDETRHLMDREMLLKCKKGAYLMNVGRGNVIPTEALLDKEVTEHFAGIWLDVCETEPLPDAHPFFSVPNMLITPHITGGLNLDSTVNAIYNICYSNTEAWLKGGELKNILDRRSGYCK